MNDVVTAIGQASAPTLDHLKRRSLWPKKLLVAVVLFGLVVCLGVPILRYHSRWQTAWSLESNHLDVVGYPMVPQWVMSAFEFWYEKTGVKIPLPTCPGGASAYHGPVSAMTFDHLALLNLEYFTGGSIQFSPEDLDRFVESSPRLNLLGLIDSDEVPAALLEKWQKANPALRIKIQGEAFPGIKLRYHADGPEVWNEAPTFPALQNGDILTEMNNHALTSYHQIKRAVQDLKPGEQLRFTVKDPAGVEREEIYTTPESALPAVP